MKKFCIYLSLAVLSVQGLTAHWAQAERVGSGGGDLAIAGFNEKKTKGESPIEILLEAFEKAVPPDPSQLSQLPRKGIVFFIADEVQRLQVSFDITEDRISGPLLPVTYVGNIGGVEWKQMELSPTSLISPEHYPGVLEVRLYKNYPIFVIRARGGTCYKVWTGMESPHSFTSRSGFSGAVCYVGYTYN